jgi:acyl-coenzyme A thioesterase PaaI-like protein
VSAAGETIGSVPHLECGPDRILRIGDVSGTVDAAVGSMRTGPWVLGPDGTPCQGTLGVIADVVWGGSAVARAPVGLWGVSTEMTINFAAALPADGSVLWGEGGVVHYDEHAALAVGTVKTGDGRIIAAGTQRTRFAPADPAIRPLPAAAVEGRATARFDELIGFELGGEGRPASLAATDAVSNPGGHVHGGIIFAISEIAAARAVAAVSPGLTTSSVTTIYLRRAQLSERLDCETEIAYRGRTAATAVVRCVRPDGKLCALSIVNFGPVAASKD